MTPQRQHDGFRSLSATLRMAALHEMAAAFPVGWQQQPTGRARMAGKDRLQRLAGILDGVRARFGRFRLAEPGNRAWMG
ncbi:hypothetical protein [Amycolatopsis albidoflavus]|uniref:Transposase n=1 Tax=Amycolatopsis albidoflavus TaxID=102226 RepID=A0ABW5HSB5_9PSEU